MGRLIAVFILIHSASLPSQVDTTFSGLRGIDDSLGVTHLFYRKHSIVNLPQYYSSRNDVYHLNLGIFFTHN